MITITDKSALLAFVNSNRQGHLLFVTAIAASLTRVSRVHSFKRPAGAFSLAFRYCEELPPGYVKNSLCKMAVLHHPANVQIFVGISQTIRAYQPSARLVIRSCLQRPSIGRESLTRQVPTPGTVSLSPLIGHDLTLSYFWEKVWYRSRPLNLGKPGLSPSFRRRKNASKASSSRSRASC